MELSCMKLRGGHHLSAVIVIGATMSMRVQETAAQDAAEATERPVFSAQDEELRKALLATGIILAISLFIITVGFLVIYCCCREKFHSLVKKKSDAYLRKKRHKEAQNTFGNINSVSKYEEKPYRQERRKPNFPVNVTSNVETGSTTSKTPKSTSYIRTVTD